MSSKVVLSTDYITEFKAYNPNHYYTYRILGDYYRKNNNFAKSDEMYNMALECEIPYKSERIEIEDIINKLPNDKR